MPFNDLPDKNSGDVIRSADYNQQNENIRIIEGRVSDLETISAIPVIQQHGFLPKSQCAILGSVDSSGKANFLSTSTDGVALSATTINLLIAYANGKDEYGQKNYIEKISVDTSKASTWGTLPAGTSYLCKELDITDPDAPTSTYVSVLGEAPEYLFALNQSMRTLCHLNGSNGAQTGTDSYGKIITFNGTAALSTSQKKFGTASLSTDGSAANYAVVPIIMNLSAWTIECWFYSNSDSQVGTVFVGGTAYGVAIGTTAARKVIFYLSTNGSTPDLDGGTTSSNTYNSASWNHIAVCFTGTHYLFFLNGVLEYDKASSTAIYNQTTLNLGTWFNHASNGFNGYIDEVSVVDYVKYPTAFTPQTEEFNYYYYLIQERTSNWTTAIANKLRVYLGEAVSNGSSVSSAITYALNGEYESEEIGSLSANLKVNKTHNIGTNKIQAQAYSIPKIDFGGIIANTRIMFHTDDLSVGGEDSTCFDRLNVFCIIDNAMGYINTSGVRTASTDWINWRIKLIAKRTF